MPVPVAGVATGDRGKLVPSVLVGAPQLGRRDERELAFELGKRLAYLRPERYVNLALLTPPRILCNDLEVAARMVATETGAMSTLPVKDRLRDLLAYSASEGYFQVRRHLGIQIRAAD